MIPLRAALLAPLLAVVFGLVARPAPAQSVVCPVPDEYSLPDLDLPAVKRAAEGHHLAILVTGGGASAGAAVHGAAYTYSARLQARLAADLPDVSIVVTSRAIAHGTAHATVAALGADLAAAHPNLVIWGVGGSEAGAGDDIDAFIDDLQTGVATVRDAGADLILMDLQYAPSLLRVVNLAPYREAVLRLGETAGVPVLDRYELMRGWSDDGSLNLDATEPQERIQVARALFDCLAKALDEAIVRAIGRPPSVLP